MDKLQDEEGIQCRPAAPDFAGKRLEDGGQNHNVKNERKETSTKRAEGNIVKNERKEALQVHEDSASRQRQYTDSVRVILALAARGRVREHTVRLLPRAARGTTVWLHRSRRLVDHTHA